MGQEKILNLFFENPRQEFHIRGIAKSLKLSKTAVSYHIDKFLKQKLVMKEKKGIFPSYMANQPDDTFRLYKQQYAVKKIVESGLISYLEKELSPNCIILFGSFAKAEYESKSDIDIFVQAEEHSLNLTKYEKLLAHKINLFFEPNPEKLSPQLLNNIINGIKLGGFLKIK